MYSLRVDSGAVVHCNCNCWRSNRSYAALSKLARSCLLLSRFRRAVAAGPEVGRTQGAAPGRRAGALPQRHPASVPYGEYRTAWLLAGALLCSMPTSWGLSGCGRGGDLSQWHRRGSDIRPYRLRTPCRTRPPLRRRWSVWPPRTGWTWRWGRTPWITASSSHWVRQLHEANYGLDIEPHYSTLNAQFHTC